MDPQNQPQSSMAPKDNISASKKKILLDQAMEHWRKRLIHLTPRNPLLHSNLRKRRLTLIAPPMKEVWSILAEEENALLLVSEDWREEEPGCEGKEAVPSDSEKDALSEKERIALLLKQPNWSRYSKGWVSYPGEKFISTLTRLKRKIRTLYEDAGFWTLFLAFGLLRWTPVKRYGKRHETEVWESPLVLLPVNLEQRSPVDPFLLRHRQEEEAQFNLALKTYLQDVEKVDLPEVKPDDLLGTLKKIGRAVEHRGWQIEPIVWIGSFHFTKMEIYQDLKNHEDRIIRHPVVQALAGVPRTDLNIPIISDKRSLDKRPYKDIATVLPADSSQLEAVLEARAGRTFWIHGPPGTGKSQTIVNIIADALAQSKTVLFVSEKRAALEVVLSRLRQVGLAPFCLDLHDYKARRGEVVESIVNELSRSWEYRSAPPSTLPMELELRRNALAQYVTAVHNPRSPLNRTPYWAIGRVNRLPVVQIHSEISLDPATLTEEKWASIMHLAHQLSSVVDLAKEGPDFPWWGLKERTFSEKEKAELVKHVQATKSATDALQSTLKDLSSSYGLRLPSTVEEATKFIDLLNVFRRLPPLPNSWIQRKENIQDWISGGKKALAALKLHSEMQEKLSFFIRTDLLFLEKTPPLSSQEVRAIEEVVSRLSNFHLLTKAFDQPIYRLLDHRPLIRELSSALERVLLHADHLRTSLGLNSSLGLKDIQRIVPLARAIVLGHRLEQAWLQRRTPSEKRARARDFLNRLSKWQSLRRSLLEIWDEALFTLDGAEALGIWKRWYKSPFRFLSPSYRRLINHLRRASRIKLPAENHITQALHSLRELQTLQMSLKVDEEDHDLIQFLGLYFQGFQTEPQRVLEALSLAEEIRSSFQTPLPSQTRKFLTGEVKASDDQVKLAKSLLEAWEEWIDIIEDLGIDQEFLLSYEGPPNILVSELQEIEEALAHLATLWKRLVPVLRDSTSITVLSTFINDLRLCLESGEDFRTLANRLASEWGWSPEPTYEHWEETLASLEVWATFISFTDEAKSFPVLLAQTVKDPRARPSTEALTQALKRWEIAFQGLKAYFEDPFPKVSNQVPFTSAQFKSLDKHLQQMDKRVEEAQRYLDLKRFRNELEGYFSRSAVNALLANVDLSPRDLPGAIERLVLTRWLDWVFANDPTLRDFRWEQHQRYVKEFQQMDRRLEQWASAQTIQTLNELRQRIIQSRSEVQVLYREARKQRKRTSIRKIIQKAFSVIQEVKPCWLMSPLSVSRFLLPDHQFDLVIFDEASQVRPEDAISAIYRAKQVIICGDPKQLPPTNFFQAHVLDETADNEELNDENAITPEGQSVLEMLEGTLPSVSLQWHYRSRDESLIAFSNLYIYGGKLITLPTPQAPNRDTGIDFRYLPNAIYERSGRRINQAEVEQVCKLVREHLERWGTQRTLGIVTMNEPQKNAVLDKLERWSLQDAKLRVLWEKSKWPAEEAFFVKNLEAVQGDERDIIIISTTYGKSTDGRLTMQFGPLSQTGGERRLNVLITRARDRVILVTSLQPEDLRLPEGSDLTAVRIFQAYLRYARDGKLSSEAIMEGETGLNYESDFEASVADVLQTWGYEVVPQYGVGPYRIDLAVRDPLAPERVQVAVECDGATYHRLPTVRERDRIRQEWLEGQGWKVVRVWSTDWWYQRKRAEERLRREVDNALKEARVEKSYSYQQPSRSSAKKGPESGTLSSISSSIPDLRTYLLKAKKVEVYQPGPSQGKAPYVGPPRIADPRTLSTKRSSHEIDVRELEDLIRVSIEALAPCQAEDVLKEVASLLGFKRLGKRIRARLEHALNNLVTKGLIQVDSQNNLRLRQS